MKKETFRKKINGQEESNEEYCLFQIKILTWQTIQKVLLEVEITLGSSIDTYNLQNCVI
jgi:hypothetical protein